MRRILKEIIALMLSITVTVIFLWNFTILVTPKQHEYGATWGHFVQETENSIDVLFIGSSMVYCDIVPAVFWEQTGLTSYVMAGPELTVPLEKYYLKEILKTQSPKAVFIELTSTFFDRYMGYTKTNIGQMPWGMNRIQASLLEAEPENIGGLLFPLLFYHERWDELTKDDFYITQNGYSSDQLAGYTFLSQYLTCKGLYTRNDATNQENIVRNQEALKEIYNLCKKNQIIPIFYFAPAVGRMPQEQVDALKTWVSSELDGSILLDCNEEAVFDTLDLDFNYDFYDALHFNAAGAEKFSVYLGKWLKKHTDIAPKSNQDTKLWKKRAAYFHEKANVPMVLRES